MNGMIDLWPSASVRPSTVSYLNLVTIFLLKKWAESSAKLKAVKARVLLANSVVLKLRTRLPACPSALPVQLEGRMLWLSPSSSLSLSLSAYLPTHPLHSYDLLWAARSPLARANMISPPSLLPSFVVRT